MSVRFNKIPVAILGATGMVGQKFIELLVDHPWFEIVALAASAKSKGKKYAEVTNWMMPTALPEMAAEMLMAECLPKLPCQIVFSALDSAVAGQIEKEFAQAGYIVISNANNHRMHSDVPLLIPEVNSSHLELVKAQQFAGGMIVTNPNCSVIGLVTALKPLVDRWGIKKCQVFTMQAISGAGYPGVASLDILDNVIPYIAGEEEKVEIEPLKILGLMQKDQIEFYEMQISAQCNRVAVTDGHMACVSIALENTTYADEIIKEWENFSSIAQTLRLPTASQKPIIYHVNEKHPQPRLHKNLERGMSVSVGRLRKCPLLDWKFVILSHNTVRGAAGCAILNAELMVSQGYIKY